MAEVPFLDLRAINLRHAEGFHQAIDRVLGSGWVMLGRELERFEDAFAGFTGAAHCVGLSNGLDALALALRALGIGPGDEVIVPAHTYIATWLGVSQTGARPVPVASDAAHYNIDPEAAAAAIGPATRAILAVHLYGHPADLDALVALAQRHGLALVEDAAQAHGAAVRGRPVGAHGDIVCWSFYPGKNLGALGDGGAATTNDRALAERLRMLRNYGSRMKYHNEVQGWNARLDELQAAFLMEKLPLLDADNRRRRSIAERYAQAFAGLPLHLPATAPWATHAWHLYVVRHAARDAMAKGLAQAGIGTVIHYPVPPHLQPAYAGLGLGAGSLPQAERWAGEVLSLPIGPTMTDAEVDRVIEAVLSLA